MKALGVGARPGLALAMRKIAIPERRKRRHAPWLVLGALLLAVRISAAPQFANDVELIDRVIELLDRRLAVMPEVAAIKFRQQKPIADPVREGEVLEQSVADARTVRAAARAEPRPPTATRRLGGRRSR